MLARINYIIAKADRFSAQVSAKITELKAKGKDTTQLESWLADFNKNIALAKQKRDLAVAKFNQSTNDLNAGDQLLKDGNQFIKDANQYVVSAHAQLIQIVQNLKQQSATGSSTLK